METSPHSGREPMRLAFSFIVYPWKMAEDAVGG